MKEIILFPFGGNAREAVPVIEAINKKEDTWDLLGFIDDNPNLINKKCLGHKVIGGREILSEYPSAKVLAVPGRPENYFNRKKIIDSLSISPERFTTLIHPAANISSSTKIGRNSLIMAGVTATVNISIGNHCVILPNTVISHDTVIDDYNMIGSNVSISGGVHIENLCYIGTGSKIIQEVTIGQGSLTGIGTIVLESIEPNSVVVGNPGRIIRKVK